MFLIKNTISYIEHYDAQCNILFSKSKDKKLFYQDSLIETDIYEFYQFANFIVINKRGKLVILNLKDNSKKEFENQSIINSNYSFQNERIVIFDRNDKKIFLHDLNTFANYTLMTLYNWEFICLFEKNTFIYLNSTLKSLSLLTGKYEWEIDLASLQLSESVTLKSIIGVWHNELLLWLNDALLVSLDVMNGELLWSYDLDESVKAFGAVLMSPFYDEKEDSDTIHCFGASGYLTFDLVNRKATFHKSFGRIGTGMSPHLSTKSGDYFYFVGRDYSIKDGLGVGIFNCKTFNIDWFYTSPEWKDGSNSFIVFSSAPQVTDNELYVLENGSGTLHIFERTETAAI